MKNLFERIKSFFSLKNMFKKISAITEKYCGYDGLLHIIFSALLFGSFTCIFSAILPCGWTLSISTVLTAVIDVVKEILDKRYLSSYFSIKDLACDALGILLVLIPCLFLIF